MGLEGRVSRARDGRFGSIRHGLMTSANVFGRMCIIAGSILAAATLVTVPDTLVFHRPYSADLVSARSIVALVAGVLLVGGAALVIVTWRYDYRHPYSELALPPTHRFDVDGVV